MTRLLILGDLAPTGFGTVTMALGRELLALGLDVRFLSQNELPEDLEEPFVSRTFQVSPEMLDERLVAAYGADSLSLRETGIRGVLDGSLWDDRWTPEVALLIGDFGNVRLLVMGHEETRKAFASLPTFHYVPIEGVDLPRTLTHLWSILRPIAMCRFGATEIAKVTGSMPPVVYHGVDTAVFHPVSVERPIRIGDKVLRTKEDCKRLFGANKHARLVLRADRNVPRKNYASLFRAMAPVLASRPDVFLMLHCLTFDQGGDLDDLRSKYHPQIRSRMISTQYHDMGVIPTTTVLAALYNAADLYVSVSAEGFGLTIAESLACGTPAVAMDYSSVPEVVGPGGVLVPVDTLTDNEYAYAWARVNEREFAKAVGELIDDPLKLKQLGRAGAKHVRESFDWQVAAQQFAAIVSGAVGQEVAA